MESMLSWLLPWEFSPTVFIACAGALALYVRGRSVLRRRDVRVPVWATVFLVLGVALDYAALQTYFDYLSQHMFWVHRLQHLVLHHIAPVLLVLAAPGPVLMAGLPPGIAAWLRGGPLWGKGARRALGLVQGPLLAPLLFVGLIYFWLTPAIHFTAMLDADRYRLMNWSMAVDGIFFWWVMLVPLAAQGAVAMGYVTRIIVLFVAALLQILLGAYITLHSTVLFDVYAICGRAWQVSPIVDQQLGGLLTWIPAAMMSGVGILIVLRHMMHEPDTVTRPSVAPLDGRLDSSS